MKNAVVKGFAKIGLLAVMTIIAASASAKAQSLEYRLTANIPFEFSIGDKKLPAGKYWVNRAQGNGDLVLQVRSADGHSNVLRMSIPVVTLNRVNSASLLFHKYGDEYFLFEVWPAGSATGRALLQSRGERELARKTQDNQIAAMNGPEVETVTIRASN